MAKSYRGDENICNGLAVKRRKQYQPSEGMRAPKGKMRHSMGKGMHKRMMGK